MAIENRYYDYIIIDAVNFAYRTFDRATQTPVQVGRKSVYAESVCAFIRAVEGLVKDYLLEKGEVFLLFDNYFSKADLKSMFMYTDRRRLDEAYKANRTKEAKEFYNSLNFLRYYYLIGPAMYHTARIDNLEADDLVLPTLKRCGVGSDSKRALLVTTDLDWSRYLSEDVDWLPKLSEAPQTAASLSEAMGFDVGYRTMTLYKVLFGDPSDNIDQITPKTEKHLSEFVEMCRARVSADDLVMMSRDPEAVDRYSLLGDVQKPDAKRKFATREAMVKINTQLVTEVPVSAQAFAAHLTTGRDADSLYRTVREAIGLDSSASFVFGNLKGARV